MTLSSKLCISLVVLALTAGGAFAATTVRGTRSNSDNKTAASADFDKSNVTDNSTGCTKGQSGGTMGSTVFNNSKSNNYRTAQGSSTGGEMGDTSHTTINNSRSNSFRTAQGSSTGGDGRSEVKDSHDRYNTDSSASASRTSAKACDNAKGHSVLMQQGRVQ